MFRRTKREIENAARKGAATADVMKALLEDIADGTTITLVRKNKESFIDFLMGNVEVGAEFPIGLKIDPREDEDE